MVSSIFYSSLHLDSFTIIKLFTCLSSWSCSFFIVCAWMAKEAWPSSLATCPAQKEAMLAFSSPRWSVPKGTHRQELRHFHLALAFLLLFPLSVDSTICSLVRQGLRQLLRCFSSLICNFVLISLLAPSCIKCGSKCT